MSVPELDATAFNAFSLAIRVVLHAYELELPASEFERPWELLREIAAGDITLSSPAEIAARFPHMRELLYESANQVIENDRDIAMRVLRGLATSFGGSDAG